VYAWLLAFAYLPTAFATGAVGQAVTEIPRAWVAEQASLRRALSIAEQLSMSWR